MTAVLFETLRGVQLSYPGHTLVFDRFGEPKPASDVRRGEVVTVETRWRGAAFRHWARRVS